MGPTFVYRFSSLSPMHQRQLATMVVPANPGSVIEFYWGNPGGENVRFRVFPRLLLLPDASCFRFHSGHITLVRYDLYGCM